MFKKGLQKIAALAISAAMILALPGITVMAASVNDINGHWAQSTITNWINAGYISGYPNGTFRPNANITRAEFATLINKAFGSGTLTTKSFTDLPQSHWAYNNMLQAVGKGFISGYPDGTIKPDASITREESAAMIAQLRGLSANLDITGNYTDSWKIASWSRPFVNAVTQFDYMSGFPDGTFRPQTPLTRAEAVTALSNVKGPVSAVNNQINTNTNTNTNTITNTNTNTSAITKDYTISTNEKTLKDKVIEGKLIFPSSLNSSSITLDNVTVKGETVISGGKKITANNCKFETVTIDKKDVEFETNKSTTVSKLIFARNATIKGYGFTDVEVDDKNLTTVRINAQVKNLNVDRKVTVKLLADADITNLNAQSKSEDTEINFTKGAEVENFDIHDTIKITGKGDIGTMTVYVSGVRSSITPDRLLRRNGASAPKYTSSSSSKDDDDDNSKYDSITIDDDDGRKFDGDGEKYNNVKIDSDGIRAVDFTVYGDLTITRNVGDGEVTLEDLDIRGDVLIYGGGDNSIIFDNCDIKGNIYSDTSNKNVSSSKQNDPVALKFDSDTDIDGEIHIRGNTILDSYGSSSGVVINNVVIDREVDNGTQLEINVQVNHLEITRKSKVELNHKSLGTVVVTDGAANSTFDLNNGAIISSVTSSGKIEFTGAGTINKLTDNKNTVALGPNVKVDNSVTPPSGDGSVTGVTLTPTSATVAVGGSTKLTANVIPSNATNKAVTFTSSTPGVASVDQTGRVTGVANGNATITVTTADGNKTATSTITVGNATPPTPDGSTKIKLDKEKLEMTVGDKETITATTDPAGQSVEWRSSNSAIAYVNPKTGEVKANSKGTAVIYAQIKTATSIDTASCNVTVTDQFSVTPSVANLAVGGKEMKVTAKNVPSNETVVWTVDNPDLIQLPAKTEGVSSITIKSKSITGTTNVTATLQSTSTKISTTVNVYDLKITENGSTTELTELTMPLGSEKTLSATITPISESNRVVWSSSHPAYVSVDENSGKIKAVGMPGATDTVTITAKMANLQTLSKKCTIKVIPAFALDKTKLHLAPGDDTITLNPINIPDGDAAETLQWNVDNNTVTLDSVPNSNGRKVVAQTTPGTATITVTAPNSGKTASCTIHVYGVSLKDDKGNAINQGGIIKMLTGEEKLIEPTVTPSGTNAVVTLISGTENMVAVESGNKLVAKGKTINDVVITAKLTVEGKEILSMPFKVKVDEAFNVTPSALHMAIGETSEALETHNKPSSTAAIHWSSSNTEVATVDNTTGKVTAVGTGQATITALSDNQTATCAVTVYGITLKKDGSNIALTDSSIIPLLAGEEQKIVAEIKPTSTSVGATRVIEWKSSHPTVITLPEDATGTTTTITAKKATPTNDNATITATLKVGGKEITKAEFKVSSENKLQIYKQPTLWMPNGHTVKLTAENVPQDEAVTWESSDNKVVKVTNTTGNANEETTLMPLKAGTATITAKAGDQTATCEVSAFDLAEFSDKRTLTQGKTENITAIIQPQGSGLNVTWTVEGDNGNEKILATTTLTNGNFQVTPSRPVEESEGVKIVATIRGLDEGELIRKSAITVKEGDTFAESITIDSPPTTMTVGETKTLTASIIPSDTTNKTVIWTTSSDTTLEVLDSASGTIKAKKAGSATITATTSNNKKAIAEIKVVPVTTKITLSPTKKTITDFSGVQLTPTITPTTASKVLDWKSSDETVATVDESGNVTPLKNGTTTITATTTDGSNKSASCAVTVAIAVTEVALDKTEISLAVGDTKTLQATVKPDTADNKNITWTSNASTVATVEDGVVTAKGLGSATITATSASNTDKKATCKVTVTAATVAPTGITVSPPSVEVPIGGTTQLTAEIQPANANETVDWMSDNNAKVSVDGTGKVTVLSSATIDDEIVITASLPNYPELTDTCTIRVIAAEPPAVRSVLTTANEKPSAQNPNTTTTTPKVSTRNNISDASTASSQIKTSVEPIAETKTETTAAPSTVAVQGVSIQPGGGSGKTTKLKAIITPTNATNQDVTWKSSDTAVARVDQKGTVTAVGEGSAVITVTTADGGKTATYDVNIQAKKIEIKSISMTRTLQLGIGAQYTMTPTIYPKNATNQNLIWESSDTSIVTVSADGTISGIKAGVAMITASSADGEKSATTNVIVKNIPLSRIALNKPRLSMITGASETLTVVTTPLHAPTGTIQWSSSDPSKVSVDQNGKVTALGKTTRPVTITAKSNLNSKFATSVITVTK